MHVGRVRKEFSTVSGNKSFVGFKSPDKKCSEREKERDVELNRDEFNVQFIELGVQNNYVKHVNK